MLWDGVRVCRMRPRSRRESGGPRAAEAADGGPQRSRATIILATADRRGMHASMRRTGNSKTAVWRWQERVASEPADRSLRDRTRPVQRVWAAAASPFEFQALDRPTFVTKVRDIVGLSRARPAHALALSIDQKSQIQALDRRQPGLPLEPALCPAGARMHFGCALGQSGAACSLTLVPEP